MSGRSTQRKLGTTRGSPRRSRTAKASRISRYAVKSRCACEWGGWGRLSDDGPGQHNPDPSEDPWGCGASHFMAVHHRACGPGTNGDPAPAAECTKGGCKPAVASCMSGADLSEATAGKVPSESQPCSRIGENPPYGMRGGIEETSASCEARYAPRSYPTELALAAANWMSRSQPIGRRFICRPPRRSADALTVRPIAPKFGRDTRGFLQVAALRSATIGPVRRGGSARAQRLRERASAL
jgi:hypothetical protein